MFAHFLPLNDHFFKKGENMKIENTKLLNMSEDILIGEKEYKVKELSLQEVLSFMKDFAKEMYLKDAGEVAALLPENERSKFLVNVWKDLPRGASLDQLSGELLATPEAIFTILSIALSKSKSNKITKEQAKELLNEHINNDNIEYYINIAMRTIGLGDNLEEVKEEKVEGETEKNA
jgi:hypothetical protein